MLSHGGQIDLEQGKLVECNSILNRKLVQCLRHVVSNMQELWQIGHGLCTVCSTVTDGLKLMNSDHWQNCKVNYARVQA